MFPYFYSQSQKKEKIYICTWVDMIPNSVIKQFEQETGIKVFYDFLDNSDILEVKLFTGNPGYDIMTPSAMPHLHRGIEMGIFEKLDKKKLPNLKNISESVYEKIKSVKDYGIVYGFGTFGLLYNSEVVERIFPVVDSYEMLFDPEKIKKIAPYGVALSDEWQDVLTSILNFYKTDDMKKAYKVLSKIRLHIKYFNVSRHANDFAMEEIVVSFTPNHEAIKAVKFSENKKFKFMIPKDEKNFWCDTLAIVKKAPHLKNAYKFINFLLRPDIAAKITNETLLPNGVSYQYRHLVREDIRNNKQLFLDDIEKYHLHKTMTLKEYREVSENWMRIVMR
ncbi:MAG: extracellular solute-binding protein [Alphaproteobacteria bacterium]|nr:MAG: extracellular solute-binding protein [Alphaproteobacteria bacterium]